MKRTGRQTSLLKFHCCSCEEKNMMSGKGKPSQKKGILKLKEVSKSSSKVKIDTAEIPSKETVITYPIVKTCDKERLLPRYSAVLRRNEEEGVGMDDLDALQLELETLLSAVAVRTRVLQEEILTFNNGDDRQDKRGKTSPLIPGKRVRFHDRVVVKKFKETSGKSVEEAGQPPVPSKLVKMKSMASGSPDGEVADPVRREAVNIVLPKNDNPDKFWAFVDPYCAEITPDDIKLLEALIEENSNEAEYYEVPPLGHLYSLRWAEEDNAEESGTKNEAPAAKKDKPTDITTGPLSQRLISALMEENCLPVDMMCKGDENRTPQMFKNISASAASNLERRVRKELEEQGILDLEEIMQDEDSDEILLELQRCQEELKQVTSFNAQHLDRLLKQASTELTRQDLRKLLQQADNEVVEVHRKVLAARQKKKALSDKEQEVCWKALEERDKLLRHIDSLQ